MTDIINRQVIGDGTTWATSTQVGAPQMFGVGSSNGQLLQVLDAVLVDGFNSQTATGVELLTDGFLKIKFGTVVDYRKRQKLLISGANDANLNGEHVVTEVVGNDVVIRAPDVSVLTGAIKTKVAPLGWESIFGSTEPLKRAYRSKNPNSTQTVLYLDMTLPSGHGYSSSNPVKRAMVSICEDMIDIGVQINSYTDVKNDYATNPNGSLFWHQARGVQKNVSLTETTAHTWTIVGNGDYFYFMPTWINVPSGFPWSVQDEGFNDFYCFGDFPSFAGVSDEWSCAWAGAYAPNDVTSGYHFGSFNGSNVGATNSKFYISSYNGFGNMLPFSFRSGGTGSYYSGAVAGFDTPNPTTQSLICERLHTVSQGAVRSIAPRLLSVNHNLGRGNKEINYKFIGDYLFVPIIGTVNPSTLALTVGGYFAFDMGD